jgi:hypothetical protein
VALCRRYQRRDNWHTLTIADGKLADEHGKILLDVKNNLKITNQTNCVLKANDWINPMYFSWREDKDERTMAISDGTNVIRQIRVKLWKTDPPVEFAFCGLKHANDLILLQKKLQAENIPCTEVRSAPKMVSSSFSVNPKDFRHARTAAAKIISENSLSVNVETAANGSGYEVFENGKKARDVNF